MSLAADIQGEVKHRGGNCTIATLRQALTDSDVDDLNAALSDLTIPGAAIAKALTNRGHQVSSSTINRHRNGGCTCGRPTR